MSVITVICHTCGNKDATANCGRWIVDKTGHLLCPACIPLWADTCPCCLPGLPPLCPNYGSLYEHRSDDTWRVVRTASMFEASHVGGFTSEQFPWLDADQAYKVARP